MSIAEKEDCFSLTWEIENYKLFLENGALTSPIWKIESSEGSTWLYLSVHHFREDVHFRLFPLSDSWSPDKCEIFLISSFDKVPTKALSNNYFSIKKSAIFGKRRKSILPKDTLTVCCRVWKETLKPEVFRISSLLQNVNYLWKVEGFNAPFHSISYSFVNKESQLFYITLDKESEDKDQYTVTVRGVTTREGILSIVNCEITANVGLERVMTNRNSIPDPTTWKGDVEIYAVPGTSLQLQLEILYTIGTIPASSSSLSSDLQHLYKDGLYSDVKINTEGKSFLAHRNILAARSQVFRAMFEKDEGQLGVVDIEGIDSETVDRMLVFLYSDSLDDVQWEEALALYTTRRTSTPSSP